MTNFIQKIKNLLNGEDNLPEDNGKPFSIKKKTIQPYYKLKANVALKKYQILYYNDNNDRYPDSILCRVVYSDNPNVIVDSYRLIDCTWYYEFIEDNDGNDGYGNVFKIAEFDTVLEARKCLEDYLESVEKEEEAQRVWGEQNKDEWIAAKDS
ncbi:hypothetical protein phiOC_p238 [Ochrobactrum phage vB_OspM_OC]|nr:hypothetical protein phiOC_p238 [Ochrobactrum phage vB_OspM_OC]